MRLFYLDSGLRSWLGHHGQSARVLLAEFRSRGIPTLAYGCADVEESLAKELDVTPLFRCNTYFGNTGDPISGWLEAFLIGAQLTAQDLARVGACRDDLVYFNSAQAPQLYGIVQYLHGAEAAKRPTVVVEMGTDPGLEVSRDGDKVELSPRDPRQDARATLYHFTSNQMNDAVLARLVMATFDRASSSAYEALFQRPVVTLPVPRQKAGFVVPRGGVVRPITVSMLGHGRGEKGTHLGPEIVEGVLSQVNKSGLRVRFLCHNGAPEQSPKTQGELRVLAAKYPQQLMIDERCADDKIWTELLDQSDVIVLPYDPDRFAISYSSLACEAIANGIPIVCQHGTTMQNMAHEFNTGGSRYQEWTVESIVQAIQSTAGNFDTEAQASAQAALSWAKTHGPAKTVDAILREAGVQL